MAQGGKPLLGLLEVPLSWLSAFGWPLASAFDPCINVAIGTAMLSEFDAACATKGSMLTERARMLERTNRRVCVLRKYEAGYRRRRLRRRHPARKLGQKPAIASIEDAPIFAPPERTHPGGPTNPRALAPPPPAPRARRGPPCFGLSALLSVASRPPVVFPFAPAALPARREGTRLPAMRPILAEKLQPRARHRRGAAWACSARPCTSSAAKATSLHGARGHILEMALPEAYGEAYKTWRPESLPIAPKDWKLEVSAPDLVASIRRLLRSGPTASSTPSDPDREGQLLVDEVLGFLGYRGPVDRLLVRETRPRTPYAASSAPSSRTNGIARSRTQRSRASAPTGSSA